MKDMIYLPTLSILRNENRASGLKDKFIEQYDCFIDTSDFESVELYFRDMANHFFREGFNEGYQQATADNNKIS